MFSVFSSAGQELAENNIINNEQISFGITDKKMSDADILQSLDEVVNQLDNEISLLEERVEETNATQDLAPTKKAMVSTIEKDIFNSAINTVNEDDNFNNSLLLNEEEMLDNKIDENDMDLFDCFDELTLEELEFDEPLYTNDLINEPDDKQILRTFSNQEDTYNLPTSVKALSNNLSTPFDNTPLQNKIMTSQGVGIIGVDEQIINNLDNSDLMDYIEESDLWTEDIIDNDIEIEFHE